MEYERGGVYTATFQDEGGASRWRGRSVADGRQTVQAYFCDFADDFDSRRFQQTLPEDGCLRHAAEYCITYPLSSIKIH